MEGATRPTIPCGGATVYRGREPSRLMMDRTRPWCRTLSFSSGVGASRSRPRISSETPSGGRGLMSAAPQNASALGRLGGGRGPRSCNTALSLLPGSKPAIAVTCAPGDAWYVRGSDARESHLSSSGRIASASEIVSGDTSCSSASLMGMHSISLNVHTVHGSSPSRPTSATSSFTDAADSVSTSRKHSLPHPSTSCSQSGSCSLRHRPILVAKPMIRYSRALPRRVQRVAG